MLIVTRQFIKPYQIGSQIHHVFNYMLTINNRQFITHTKSSVIILSYQHNWKLTMLQSIIINGYSRLYLAFKSSTIVYMIMLSCMWPTVSAIAIWFSIFNPLMHYNGQTLGNFSHYRITASSDGSSFVSAT